MGGGGAAHIVERLADGGEAGADGGGSGNIVKADDGDIARDVKAGFVKSGDRTHGGDVVEGEDGREGFAPLDESAGGLMAGFGAGLDAFELDDELGVYGDVQFSTDFADGIPAGGGIGTEALPLDEGDATVAERGEVIEGVACSGEVIEFNGDDTFAVLVTGDGDNRNRKIDIYGRIDGNNAFDGAGEQQARVAHEEIGAMAVTDDEVEVFLLQERIFDAPKYGGGVAFADFRDHDADGEAAFVAELACDGIGFVIEESGCLEDALLGLRRNAVLVAGIVHDAGDGALREPEVGCELLEFDGSGGLGLVRSGRSGTLFRNFIHASCLVGSETNGLLSARGKDLHVDGGEAALFDDLQG